MTPCGKCRLVEGEGRAPVTCQALPGIQCANSCNETFTRFDKNILSSARYSVDSQVWEVQLDQWLPLRHCAPSLRLPRHVWCWQVHRYFRVMMATICHFFRQVLSGLPCHWTAEVLNTRLLLHWAPGLCFNCEICGLSGLTPFSGWCDPHRKSGSWSSWWQPLHY